ncbi:MAG: MBL fold metallo-hydrolase [Alphaproteobacteria bacterium]|nr:MBL fold metallo-hydrolase [Alphaproteobacteria bacterium]
MKKSMLALGLLMVTSACDGSGMAEVKQPSLGGPQPVLFEKQWNAGLERNEPKLQVQKLEENIVVIRQSLLTNFESPFMYLLLGDEKALLIDTGASDVGLRKAVDGILDKWQLERNLKPLSLIVMHSHGHGDHVYGDSAFKDRPNTTIVGHSVDDVKQYFGLSDWPEGSSSIDLGGQEAVIFPAPGHHDSHLMIHPKGTQYLLTGDSVYPGRLYFRCDRIGQFKNTIDKIGRYAEANGIKWALGTHIEMKNVPGETFSPQDNKRPNEHLLELPSSIFADISAALSETFDAPVVKAYDYFVLFPHPADPRGKTPPNWCAS